MTSFSLPLSAEDPLLQPSQPRGDGALAYCLAVRHRRRGWKPEAETVSGAPLHRRGVFFWNVPSTSLVIAWQEGKNCKQQDALVPAGDREAHRRPPDVEIQMGRDQRLVDVQHAEDGFLLVVRRLRRRQHGGPQDPHPSRRDAAEVCCVTFTEGRQTSTGKMHRFKVV